MKTPVKLLYLEDDELDRRAFLRMVREKNLPYDLSTAETLAQARAHLATSPFDVILADYHLPDGHSTELFDEVPDTPFILMTGTLEEQLALRTLERGADDYLAKDPQQRHLEAVPFAVEKTLYRHSLRGVEKRLTGELREQDRRTRLAQQANGVGTFEWDIPHNQMRWSPELERLYGLPPGGFGGRFEAWIARVHPEDRRETERQHERALTTGRMEADWRVVWPDGTVHWLAGRATVEMDAAGKPLRMLGVNIDVTDRKQAEAEIIALRDRLAADLAGMNRLHEVSTRFVSQDDLQTLLDAVLDAAIAITGADKGHLQLLNLASGELGITGQRGFDPAFVEFFNHIRAGVVACGTAMQTRQCVVVEDVTLSPLFLAEPRALELVLAAGMRAVVCTPLLTRAGQLVGVLSILFAAPHRPSDRDLRLLDLLARQAADFIERTQAEAALREAQAQLRMITDTMAAGVVRCSRDYRYLWVSPAYARWLGRSPEEIAGRPIPEVLGTAGYEALRPHIEQVLAGQRVQYEMEVDFLGPGVVWFHAVYTPTYDAAGGVDGWVAVVTDITERKRAEEAQARLAAIVEWSEDAIVSKTLDGKIRTWNAGAERMFGYRAEEVIGRPVTLLIPPERLDEENVVLERLKCGKPIEHYETVRVTKDGRRLDVSLTISPVKDSQGRIIGASKIARDIGDIVRARQVLARNKEELERLVDERTAKLREAMADLEHMSYSMVHDMRAPLRAMNSFATMIEQECAGCSRPPGLDYLRRIRESADRLDRLVTDALNYNKVVRQELPVTSVDIGRLLRSMVETYPNLQPPAADITIEFNELVVLGNESLLTQCFGNLLDNAGKFLAPGVKPRIRVWAEPSTIDHQPSTIICIKDNGIGIPTEAQEKIFRMFQRMHRQSEYPGTGIGLAIVRKAVERMGGQVGLESDPGKGSKFWIELPRPAEAQNQERLEDAA